MDKIPTLNYRPKKTKPYLVRFYENNRRTSRAFSARMDAMQFMAEKSGDARASQYDISTDEKEAFMRIKRECKIRGLSFTEMTDTFVQTVRNKPVYDYSLGELIELYIEDCEKRKLRHSTIKYYRQKLNKLCETYGTKINISAITTDMLESFITTGTTHAHNRRALSAFYRFVVSKRILEVNPVSKVITPRVRKRHKLPTILSVAEMTRLLQEVPESFVAAIVLMGFFGIRPQEISNESGKPVLKVSDINFEARTIRISDETAKMGNFRIISNVPEIAWKWLEKYLPKSGNVFPHSYSTYRRLRRLFSVKLPHDVLRHSFASYGYHKLGIEKTVEILGQESGYEVYKNHYKAMVRPEDGERYFSISPDIRNGLPRRRVFKLGEPHLGLSGELYDNIAYLNKQK